MSISCLVTLVAAMAGCPSTPVAPTKPKVKVSASPSPAATETPIERIDHTQQGSPSPAASGASPSPQPSGSPTGSPVPSASPTGGSPKPSASPTSGATASPAVVYTVGTLAGSNLSGPDDGSKDKARFNGPNGLHIDAAGNLYVADAGNHRIRKVTPTGDVTTVGGDASGLTNGPALSARFKSPYGLAVAANGDIYVADTGNQVIRKISDGNVTTVAGDAVKGLVDETGEAAQFNQPFSLTLDAKGSIYVADAGNHAIRKIDMTDPGKPIVSTLAGGALGSRDGALADARFNTPNDVDFGPDGTLYVADFGNNAIRAIDLVKKTVRTVAGGSVAGFRNGTGSVAAFNSPTGLAVGLDGVIYVADNQNHRIRRITPTGEVTSIAGQRPGFADGVGDAAQFYEPTDVVVGKNGILYVADTRNQRIRTMSPP